MGLPEMLRTSLTALRAHKLRTSLSVLGIVIGVAAVVAIIAIVNGATADMKEQIAGLGMRTITISIFPQAMQSATSVRALTEELTADLEAATSVSQVVPTASGQGSAVIDGGTYQLSLMGVTPEYADLFDGFYARSGRFLHALDEERKVAVLGAGVAEDYFGGADPVGARLKIEISGVETAFRIIGVMSERGRVGYQSLDDSVYVPLTTMQALSGSRQFTSYIAQASDEEVVEQAAAEIEAILDRTIETASDDGPMRRMSRTPYVVQVQKEAIETYEESVNTMTFILGGVGAISLLVGGIGIMNIMLVSVTERTREIGVRMAVGARRGDILLQFLVEALIISLVGGAFGLLLGMMFADLLDKILEGMFRTEITMNVVITALATITVVGVFSGLYPAFKASRLDPVEALRYE